MPVRLVSHEEPIPGYRLLERLGRGGFGEVWKVEAPGGLLKAMKFVFGDLDAAEEDGRPAEQELKALNRVKQIRHPYILSLERFDVVDGQLIIVMELADRNLWDRFRECRARGLPGIPRDELLRYMEESSEALDLMNNQHQIQHLDVKPQNLFLVYNHVKVADFGLAKVFEGARATVTGGVTPVYAAPETFEGWISRFSDQYSLAIVFQELLTGHRPFNGANTKQLLLQHLNGTPDLSSLPETDRPVIARALHKTPDDRWQSCMEMIRALRIAGGETVAVGSGAIAYPPPRGSGAIEHPAPRARSDTPIPGSSPAGPASPPPSPPAAPDRGRVVGSPAFRHGHSGSGSLSYTPGPALITPRLVTPLAAAGSAPTAAQTMQRPAEQQTGRMSTLGIAPPEKTGPGTLMPALIVGVGQIGLGVICKLRQLIAIRFGSPDALPTIRFLYLDTDPEAIAAATQGPDALPVRDVVLARLHRPAYYLQQGKLTVESWMPRGLLYQLPKNPGPAGGVRAFGRLALLDHYRMIAQRIRQELEPFLTDELLDKTAEETGLGVRTNRTRAYLVAGLAGGTGSGMVVDLAYVVKHELRAVGYRKPETVGVLLVPPADPVAVKPPVLANTYAALAEVGYFTGGRRYQHRFDENEPPITDADGPFARCSVVPLPKLPRDPERDRALGLAARGVFVELLTPVGRVNDYVRFVTPVAGDAAAPVGQSYGLYHLTWPRAELLSIAVRRFEQRLLLRWAAKESGHLREPVRAWLADQWVKQQLDAAAVLKRFEQVAAERAGEDTEAVFEALIQPLRVSGSGRVDALAVCEVVERLHELVGKPDGEDDTPGTLTEAVRLAYKPLAKEAEDNLGAMAVSFIEQPQYRLAGAEEALIQITSRLKHTMDDLERDRAALGKEVEELYSRLFQILTKLRASGRGAAPVEVVDLLRTYPTRRLRLTQFDSALAVYRCLLGIIPECLRDVAFCRTRLTEMAASVAEGVVAAAHDTQSEALILPPGCESLDAAVDQFLASLAPDDLLAIDQGLQSAVARKYRAVANVCLKPERTGGFMKLLSEHSRAFLDGKLEQADPAAAFLRYRGDGDDARKLLSDGFARSAPGLTAVTGQPLEGAVLAAPPGESGDRLRKLAAEACPGIEFIPAPMPDDVLFYRELPRVPFADLPQRTGPAEEAYEAILATDRPPHTRADIHWNRPG
jgi:serine/threonine protein kinase